MKALTIITFLWAGLFLQSPSFAQQNPIGTSNSNVTATTAINPNHLITVTADYNAKAISIFYPDRTELIYVKVRRSRWVNNYKYAAINYDVFYQDGTQKRFENVELFRREDVMQRVVTDHLSKLQELGYELLNTNMTDFNDDKFLTAFLKFRG